MSKFLILGDLHIGSGISIGKPSELGKLNSRIQDQVDLLNWVLDLCINRNIKLIFITGDVYQDYRPHPTIIGIFMRWLKKCEHNNICVHIVMGNHDILRSGQYVVSALDLVSELELQNANVHKAFTQIELDDFSIVLMPFRDKRMYDAKTKEEGINKFQEELKNNTAPTDKIRIGIGHLALEGSLSIGNEISDHLNELYLPKDIFDEFDYVWMGHIHHPQIIQNTPYLAHIGSLDRSDFSNTEVNNDKIAILIDSELNNNFTEISLPIRPLRPVKIEVPNGKDSTEYVINELCLLSKKLRFDEAIVKIDIQLNGSDMEAVSRDKIKSYILNNLKAHHISAFSESRCITIQRLPNSFGNSINIEDAIIKWADTKDIFTDHLDKDVFKTFAMDVCNKYREKCNK